ncbi:hypothetical protein [Aneurinibacillus thermoaerophilus]|uniref:hypothetical protein n=1 Tax=Aneurinibacillus thermoaerophilus TaxID=143495 RepID=UPI002E1F338E|nr:hypothetical protein [Aneurinibacillus thermoaerophilus]
MIFTMRALTLKRSISGLHLMDRLNEGKYGQQILRDMGGYTTMSLVEIQCATIFFKKAIDL